MRYISGITVHNPVVMSRDKKGKKSVVCPERYVIVEDLNLGSLRVGRPDFCPVMVFIGAAQ